MSSPKSYGFQCVVLCAALFTLGFALAAAAQEPPTGQESLAPRSQTGKHLLGTLAALRLERVTTPRISPGGARVAYLVSSADMPKGKPWKEVTHLWVVPTAGPASAARQYTRGDKSLSDISWSPNGKLLAFLMEGEKKEEGQQVWFMYADGGEPWQVTHHKSGVRDFSFSPDGKTLLLVATAPPSKAEGQRKKEHDDAVIVNRPLDMDQLWTWDIASETEKQITHGDFSVSIMTHPQWSPDGTHITFTTNPRPGINGVWMPTLRILDVANDRVRKLVPSVAHTVSARWSHDGRSIAFYGTDGRPGPARVNLYAVRETGGAPRNLGTVGSVLFETSPPEWSPNSKTIFFVKNTRESNEIFSADVAAGGIRQVTQRSGVFTLDAIGSNSTAIGTFSDPTHPANVFRSDLSFHPIHIITDQNAWLSDYALGRMEVIHWKSKKDGKEIDGIVTLPVDFQAGHKYPFLLNPHGGPTGASTLTFNPQEQVLAANGYLVLQPNFRGSTGRGFAFAAANEHDMGGGDYQDDMSGVDAVITRGWVDPNRMGAFGWSYGGFMTYWIDTQTDRFKAISPGAGLTDIYSMYSETDIHPYIAAFFGGKAPWDDFNEYWAHSPMKYVENVKTPTMILVGQADHRVPLPQDQEFYRALRDRHVPVEFIQYPRERHGFVESRHIQDRWQRYLVFFGKYLDNPPVTEPEATVKRMQRDLP